jgi:hypothetical protein
MLSPTPNLTPNAQIFCYKRPLQPSLINFFTKLNL